MISINGARDNAPRNVFLHADHLMLRKLREFCLQVQQAMSSSGRSVEDTFKAWDTNGDKWLSKDELKVQACP